MKRFDAYEVNPVIESDDGKGGSYCEAYLAVSEAEEDLKQYEGKAKLIWSLYGHRDGEGVECIADFEDEAAAFQMLFAITGIIGVSGKTVYQLPEAPDEKIRQNTAIETFFDLVADFHFAAGEGKYKLERLAEDSRDRLSTLIAWANEFQKLHKATDWSAVEYMDEQEAFLAKKVAELS